MTMRFIRAQPKAALLLTGLFLASPVIAQGTTAPAAPAPTAAEPEDQNEDDKNNNDDDIPKPSADGPPAITGVPEPESTAPPAQTTPPRVTNAPAPTTAAAPAKTEDNKDEDNTSAPQPTVAPDTPETIVITAGEQSGTNDVKVSFSTPVITGDGGSGGAPPPSALPKLPNQVGIPGIQVPNTANAPYMRESDLPAGTVFIAVGAILGLFFLCVGIWRVTTVMLLKRNMKLAAQRNHGQDTKTLLNFRPPEVPMYKFGDKESTISLAKLTAGGQRTPGKGGRPATAGSGPMPGHGSNLFFSPTAGAGQGNAMLNHSNRGSAYLPQGYYAAGAAAPGNDMGMSHIGGSGRDISLSNLGPQTQGYGRARSLVGGSPLESPSHHGQDRLQPGVSGGNFSTSTLDLSRAPQGRAPSAYLEDLFDDAGAVPGNYPPSNPNYNGGRL